MSSTRRVRLLVAVVCLALLAALGGWLLGRRVRSPAEVASARKPPTASLITVPVEEKVLSSDVVIRGTIRFAEPRQVGLAGPLGGAAATSPIVTRAPRVGDELTDGAPIVEASGRPVFALVGADPMYRPITPGATGHDVRQLEQGLLRIGIDPGPVDGVYDEASAAAVDRWYRSRGFQPQGPTEDQRTQLRALRANVFAATDSLRAAQKALAEGSAGLTESETLELEIAVRGAQSAVDAATIDQTRNNTLFQGEVTAKQAARDAAAVARDTAKAAGAVNPSTGVAFTPAELAVLDDAMVTAQGELDSTSEAAEAARAAGARGLQAANDQLQLAQLRRDERAKPSDTSRLRQVEKDAQTSRTQADEELAGFEKELGASIPAGELIFFPVMPLRVDDITVIPGDVLSGRFLTVSGSAIQIDATVSAADVDLLKTGTDVTVVATDVDESFGGTIGEVASTPGTHGAPESRFYVGVIPADSTKFEPLAGSSVRITVPVKSTGGAKVLAVPLAAVSTSSDGTSQVEVGLDDGTTRDVAVTVGLSAQGFVQVTPVKGEELTAGDKVVVGLK